MSTAGVARGRRLIGTAAVGLLTLSACGSDDEASSSSDLIGTWEVTDSNATWEIADGFISISGGVIDAQTYTATDTTIEMTDEPGLNACPSSQPGTYEWEIEEDVLMLTVVSDQCSGRKNTLDGRTLERVE